MRTSSGISPTWLRALGVLLVVVVAIAVIRGAWDILVLAALLTLLIGAHLLRHRMRRRLLYDRDTHRPPHT